MGKIMIFKDKKTEEIVKYTAMALIGVLFCFSNSIGQKVLSIVLGSTLIVFGFVMLIITLINEQSVLKTSAVVGLIICALGVLCISENIVGGLFSIIPYILMTLGVGFIIDAFLGYFWRKDESTALFVLKLVLGVALVTFGILILTVGKVAQFVGIVFGRTLIVYGIYNIIYLIAKKND